MEGAEWEESLEEAKRRIDDFNEKAERDLDRLTEERREVKDRLKLGRAARKELDRAPRDRPSINVIVGQLALGFAEHTQTNIAQALDAARSTRTTLEAADEHVRRSASLIASSRHWPTKSSLIAFVNLVRDKHMRDLMFSWNTLYLWMVAEWMDQHPGDTLAESTCRKAVRLYLGRPPWPEPPWPTEMAYLPPKAEAFLAYRTDADECVVEVAALTTRLLGEDRTGQQMQPIIDQLYWPDSLVQVRADLAKEGRGVLIVRARGQADSFLYEGIGIRHERQQVGSNGYWRLLAEDELGEAVAHRRKLGIADPQLLAYARGADVPMLTDSHDVPGGVTRLHSAARAHPESLAG